MALKVPAAGVSWLAFVRRASRSGFATEWLKRGSSTDSPQAGVPPWCPTTTKEAVMNVMIGIDPHKASHTRWRSTGPKTSSQASRCAPPAPGRPTHRLGRTFEKRTWAIESAGGLGYLLAQQLVAQAKRCSMSRPPWPLGSGCSPRSAPTRTTPTMPTRSPSPPCGHRASRRRTGRPRRGAAALGQAQHRHR